MLCRCCLSVTDLLIALGVMLWAVKCQWSLMAFSGFHMLSVRDAIYGWTVYLVLEKVRPTAAL